MQQHHNIRALFVECSPKGHTTVLYPWFSVLSCNDLSLYCRYHSPSFITGECVWDHELDVLCSAIRFNSMPDAMHNLAIATLRAISPLSAIIRWTVCFPMPWANERLSQKPAGESLVTWRTSLKNFVEYWHVCGFFFCEIDCCPICSSIAWPCPEL